MKKQIFAAAAGLMIAVSGVMFSATPAHAITKGQQTLVTKRAATVDAYRNMAEQVKGLQVDSSTYVKDFVAEYDEVKTLLDTYLKGCQVVNTQFFTDGSCEVTVELIVEDLVKQLQTWEHRYPWGGARRFDKVSYYTKQRVLTATGNGAPRPEPAAPAATPYGGARVQRSVAPVPTEGIPGWEGVGPQGRLLAVRAAKVDAYRNLAEHVYGLQITSDTYVRDFVAESDEIKTQMSHFLKGAKILEPYHYYPDAIVEVEVEISVQEVIVELKKIYRRMVERGWNWRRETVQVTTFENIVDFYPEKIIRGKGAGTVPAKYLGRPGASAPVAAPQPPAWAGQVVSAVGNGVAPADTPAPQARLMAERAAKVDGMRNLAEMVYGVAINSTTTVRDFVTSNDTVRADVSTFLAGARASEPRFLPDGSCEVTVEIALDGLWNVVRKYQN